jgi:hypothetical protein
MSVSDTIGAIQEGVYGIYGISKHLFIDELTNKHDKNIDNFIMIIRGSNRLVRFPAGFIAFKPYNMWLYILAQLHFIIEYNILPFSHIDLPNILKICRSNGAVHEAYFDKDNGFLIDTKHNSLTIGCNFNAVIDNELPSKYSEMTKIVKIDNIINMNHLDTIEYSLLPSDLSDNMDLFDTPFKLECLEYYLKMINKWNNDTLIPFLKLHDINMTRIDNITVENDLGSGNE